MPFLLQNQEFHGYHGDNQDDTLREFYQKLSYFLMTGEHSKKEIMEEIEQQISNLQQKVNVHRFQLIIRFLWIIIVHVIIVYKDLIIITMHMLIQVRYLFEITLTE